MLDRSGNYGKWPRILEDVSNNGRNCENWQP